MVDSAVVANVVCRELSSNFGGRRTSCASFCDRLEIGASPLLAGFGVVLAVLFEVAVLSTVGTIFLLCAASDGAVRSWYHCGDLGEALPGAESDVG